MKQKHSSLDRPLYLGRMAAQVKASDVTHAQVVELITSGRSGDLGLSLDSYNGFSDSGEVSTR